MDFKSFVSWFLKNFLWVFLGCIFVVWFFSVYIFNGTGAITPSVARIPKGFSQQVYSRERLARTIVESITFAHQIQKKFVQRSNCVRNVTIPLDRMRLTTDYVTPRIITVTNRIGIKEDPWFKIYTTDECHKDWTEISPLSVSGFPSPSDCGIIHESNILLMSRGVLDPAQGTTNAIFRNEILILYAALDLFFPISTFKDVVLVFAETTPTRSKQNAPFDRELIRGLYELFGFKRIITNLAEYDGSDYICFKQGYDLTNLHDIKLIPATGRTDPLHPILLGWGKWLQEKLEIEDPHLNRVFENGAMPQILIRHGENNFLADSNRGIMAKQFADKNGKFGGDAKSAVAFFHNPIRFGTSEIQEFARMLTSADIYISDKMNDNDEQVWLSLLPAQAAVVQISYQSPAAANAQYNTADLAKSCGLVHYVYSCPLSSGEQWDTKAIKSFANFIEQSVVKPWQKARA
eukprot:TRINITY_DN13191_c0_g1_i1.p1 TRINITY_DN13191_c0_g1~~TRINITY_DN13191_c0_g1_i1.p1  ORF type:complete len:462 (-),score=57.94 TRINITY_DN13191_c0_g1_i1:71-1456(-)